VKTIEELLQNLGRANVTEFALVSQRLPCVKVNGAFKPVDDYAPTTEEILEMLVAAGGSWYIASLGPAATQWALNVEGIGTVGVQAIMREGNVQARFMVTQRDPFAVPAVAPAAAAPPPTCKIATRPQAGGAPPSRVAGAPALQAKAPPRQNPPFPPAPPSSAVALIANEPFIDDDPRSTLGQQAPTTRDLRPRGTPPRAPLPAPPLVAMEPGTEEPAEGDAADLFEFSPRAPLPAPGAPEALVAPDWKATQISAPVARSPQQQQPARPEPRAADNSQAAMAEMDSLVLRLAEELDVGPRRVRVVIELVLETIDRTGLPPREALEALAAAEKAAKKK
jgi:hypothetical protein